MFNSFSLIGLSIITRITTYYLQEENEYHLIGLSITTRIPTNKKGDP